MNKYNHNHNNNHNHNHNHNNNHNHNMNNYKYNMNNYKYNMNNYKYNINLESLQKFMLYTLKTEDNIKSINTIDTVNSITTEKNNVITNKKLMFTNYNKLQSKYNEKLTKLDYNYDKFFWCFYKLKNNINDDDLVYINKFTTEKKYKLDIINYIRTIKNDIKKYKIKKNLLEDNLSNDKSISLETFISLVLIYNIKLLIVKNNTFCYYNIENTNELSNENNNNLKIINLNYYNNCSKSNNFDINDSIKYTNDELNNIITKYYCIENFIKPIKSLSSYKLDELLDIANKLKLNIFNDSGKKKIKKELYELIYNNLN